MEGQTNAHAGFGAHRKKFRFFTAQECLERQLRVGGEASARRDLRAPARALHWSPLATPSGTIPEGEWGEVCPLGPAFRHPRILDHL